MFCTHGMIQEECPHCQMEIMQKPKQLVKLAPKELPMEIPAKEDLLNTKDVQDPKIFENTILSANMPRRLVRSHDLGSNIMGSQPNLFQQRMNFLHEKIGKQAEEIDPTVELFNLKKKFTSP